jgi:hypothetical protein
MNFFHDDTGHISLKIGRYILDHYDLELTGCLMWFITTVALGVLAALFVNGGGYCE